MSNPYLRYDEENNKVYFSRKAETTTLFAMEASGSGDPHMILRVKNGAVLARWDDNAPGSEDTELLFFYLKTPTDEIAIFYTNTGWGTGPKVIGGNRYIHNGVEVVNFTGTVVVGPVTLTTSLYSMYLSFDSISNVEKFGGGVFAVLKAAINAGGYVDGGWGPTVDGYGALGINRSSLVVGEGITIQEDGSISGGNIQTIDQQDSKQTLKSLQDLFVGFNAEKNNLPLDPVALQLADMNAPGGDFDGIVNPPGNVNGIIAPDGTTGAGMGILMPGDIAYAGNYSANPPTYAAFILNKEQFLKYSHLF